jgi:hypothetical protein
MTSKKKTQRSKTSTKRISISSNQDKTRNQTDKSDGLVLNGVNLADLPKIEIVDGPPLYDGQFISSRRRKTSSSKTAQKKSSKTSNAKKQPRTNKSTKTKRKKVSSRPIMGGVPHDSISPLLSKSGLVDFYERLSYDLSADSYRGKVLRRNFLILLAIATSATGFYFGYTF